MKIKSVFLLLVAITVLSGCSTVSSSRFTGPEQPAWQGQVFVSEAKLPANVENKVVGVVEAKARSGYGHVEKLYPRLAIEAGKIGANAVVDVSGSHQVTGFSWAAPFASGTAVRVDDVQQLET